MSQPMKDSFLDLERHRQLLEENLEKLQKSMRHWQMWEAEYEGLKEEVLAVKPGPQQLREIADAYEGELVTKKEILDLFGESTARTPAQVVNLLDRRIDYVEQNVRTLQKQIETADERLAAASVVSAPGIVNEDGLPITEIMEDLDEEGNVIASRISTPGDSRPQLLEVLQKAGIKDLPEISTPSSSMEKLPEAQPTVKPSKEALPIASAKSKSTPSKDAPKTNKKGVSFSDDTKSGPDVQKSHTAQRLEQIMDLAKKQEALIKSPIIPQNESPEDAALRQEMLQYGMSEVSAVVAEIELEDGSDWSDEDYEDHEDAPSDTDDEDMFGRSTGKVVDDELRKRMMELEERLGVGSMLNAGKGASEYGIVQEGIGRVAISSQEDVEHAKTSTEAPLNSAIAKTKATGDAANKKSVRFSDNLDISDAPKPPTVMKPEVKERLVDAVSDIVERNPLSEPSVAPVPPQTKPTSKFKAARKSASKVINGPLANSSLSLQPARPTTPRPFSTSIQFSPATDSSRTVPMGPEGSIFTPQIVERDMKQSTSATAPDQLDSHFLNQEIAAEHQRLRNRMIKKDGGFMKEDESEIVPFTEEEGGPKKMSRFKAARLSKS